MSAFCSSLRLRAPLYEGLPMMYVSKAPGHTESHGMRVGLAVTMLLLNRISIFVLMVDKDAALLCRTTKSNPILAIAQEKGFDSIP